MMNKLANLDMMDFVDANKLLLDFCGKGIKIDLQEIVYLLNLKDKELVESFLSNYSLFSIDDLIYIEKFINENLFNSNKVFVSDLIYFAADFGLDLNYMNILSLIPIEKEDEELLVLGCLVYIHNNIKLLYVKELTQKLNYIRDTHIYYQNEQVLASLILYRITHNNSFLNFINELTAFDESNKIFLKNTLKEECYKPEYFNIKYLKEKLKL